MIRGKTIVVRGGGDLATGVLWRLHRVGFRVACLEVAVPTVIRRTVSAAQAVFDGEARVEGVRFILAEKGAFPNAPGTVPVWVDPGAESIVDVHPDCVVDAIIAKENLGTHKGMAPLVIGLGPGFEADVDVHCVVETKRGHDLGRVIYRGSAAPNTGIPGVVGGESEKRLVRSPGEGTFSPVTKIGDVVSEGQLLGTVAGLPVNAKIAGLVRGQIHPSARVVKGMKIGDVDPRIEQGNWNTISDKALAIAGGVLEASVAAIPLS